jgi:hypothetical protein
VAAVLAERRDVLEAEQDESRSTVDVAHGPELRRQGVDPAVLELGEVLDLELGPAPRLANSSFDGASTPMEALTS